MIILMELDCILERSIDLYSWYNIEMVMMCMEVCCEKYWLLYWFGIRMRWTISMGNNIQHIEIFFFYR